MRFARNIAPGYPHHVLAAATKSKISFSKTPIVYLRLIRNACERYGTFVWAYVLMNNHVHYVMVPQRPDSLHKTIKVAHGDYTSYFNGRYGLVGQDESHCVNAVRYVERNSVRARLVW